jgi:hypothetical protein
MISAAGALRRALARAAVVALALAAAPAGLAADLDREDQAALSLALEARRLVGRVGDEIWPGLGTARIPLLVFRQGQIALLIGHPSPPQGYEPLLPSPPGAPSIAVFRGEDRTLVASTSAEIGGIRTALYSLDPRGGRPGAGAGLASGHPPAEEQIAGMVHEIFHVYSASRPHRRAGGAAGRHPDSAEALALANLEGRILAASVDLPAPQTKAAARLFSAVRAARREILGAPLADELAADEFEEGLATYTELEAVRLGSRGANGPASRGLPNFGGYRHWEWMREARLASLLVALDDPAGLRSRGYVAGAAMALLLDRIDPAWRGRAFGADRNLETLLAAAGAFRQADGTALRREAFDRHGYAALLEQAQQDMAALSQRREKVLKEFEDRAGFLVRVKIPPGGATGYRYDPQNQSDPGGPRIVHRRYLEVDLPGATFRALGAAALTEYGSAPPDLREVVFVAGDDAAWKVDGAIFYPRQGSLNVQTSLRIEAPGLVLEGGPAHLYMSGREVEIVFTPPPSGSAGGTPGSP